jgi:hypothetical protein
MSGMKEWIVRLSQKTLEYGIQTRGRRFEQREPVCGVNRKTDVHGVGWLVDEHGWDSKMPTLLHIDSTSTPSFLVG